MAGTGNRSHAEPQPPAGPPVAGEREEPALRQAWLEEQAALYQVLSEEPDRPNPVEFAARAVVPEGAGAQGFDLRARLIRRLRVLDGLNQAFGSQASAGVNKRPSCSTNSVVRVPSVNSPR